MNFTIRSYRSGDEKEILAMFNEVFGQQRALDHWNWKYRDNPYGAHIISLAQAPDGILAAHYAGYPVIICLYRSRGKPPDEILTYQICDKMTRARFRSAGIGKKALLTRTFMHFREEFGIKKGVPFAYGFTTHHSKKFGLLFLNYADIEPVSVRRLPMSRLSGIKIGRTKRLLSGIRAFEAGEISGAWTDFFARVAPYYECLVKREAPYLTWRYLMRPDRKYRIFGVRRGQRLTGWSVFCEIDNRIIWGDALFEADDIDSVKALLQKVCDVYNSKDTTSIEGWFPSRPTWWNKILDKLGFEIIAEPNGLHLTPPVFDNGFDLNRLSGHFYYTMGDSDLF